MGISEKEDLKCFLILSYDDYVFTFGSRYLSIISSLHNDIFILILVVYKLINVRFLNKRNFYDTRYLQTQGKMRTFMILYLILL